MEVALTERQQAYVDLLDFLATNTADPRAIGERVLKLAVALDCPAVDGLRQADLARMFGVSRQSISEQVDTLNQKLSEKQAVCKRLT